MGYSLRAFASQGQHGHHFGLSDLVDRLGYLVEFGEVSREDRIGSEVIRHRVAAGRLGPSPELVSLAVAR